MCGGVETQMFFLMPGSLYEVGDISVASLLFGAPRSVPSFSCGYSELMYKGRNRPLKLRSRAETEAVALVAGTTGRRVFLHLSDASPSNVFDAPNMVIIGRAFSCDNGP